MRPVTLRTTLYQDHKNSDFYQYLLYLIISFVDCVPRQLLTSSTHFFNILVIFYVRFKFVSFVYFNSSFDGKLLYILKMCEKISKMLFKNWKLLFENIHQTPFIIAYSFVWTVGFTNYIHDKTNHSCEKKNYAFIILHE